MSKILACIINNLGDFVNAIPALQAIRRRHGGDSFEICADRNLYPFAQDLNLADTYSLFMPQNLVEKSAQDAYYSQFSEIYSFLGLKFRPDLTMHRRTSDNADNTPLSKFWMDQFGLSGSFVPNINIPGARPSTPPKIAVHMAFDSQRFFQPVKDWVSTLSQVVKSGKNVMLIGSGIEGVAMEKVSSQLPKGNVEIVWAASPSDLMARLMECQSFLAMDSGPANLMAALGIRGVVINPLGANNAKVWWNHKPNVLTVPNISKARENLVGK